MKHFHRLLFVSHGVDNESDALLQALSLARNNHASLHALLVAPAFPADYPDYETKFREALVEQTRASIDSAMTVLEINSADLPIECEVVMGEAPATRVIQQVLKEGFDLVVKEAEPRGDRTGFRAFDMDLLAQCPVPVWLCRPIAASRDQIKVAVAIDPEATEASVRALSLRMLELSSSLAATCDKQLNVVSCWDYVFEEYLRSSAWFAVTDAELARTVLQMKVGSEATMLRLIDDANIQSDYKLHHLRGSPSERIPDFVREHKIDILVMGTLARTGIPGFMIGNTAEDILQQIPCSLMALKPKDFVSPVRV